VGRGGQGGGKKGEGPQHCTPGGLSGELVWFTWGGSSGMKDGWLAEWLCHQGSMGSMEREGEGARCLIPLGYKG
jgi:hypothetical protein